MPQQVQVSHNTNGHFHLVDIQSQRDERNIPIDQVGISDLHYPTMIVDAGVNPQSTVAEFSLSVGLPGNARGTHMSRFVETLHKHHKNLSMSYLPVILDELRSTLRSSIVRFEARFLYFVEQRAPVSAMKAVVDYNCRFVGSIHHGQTNLLLGVSVPVTSLCPCSKAISDYGAHNQRGKINIEVRAADNRGHWPTTLSIKRLIDIAHAAGSAPVYSLLKRDDEREVTMRAFDNPAFVEDIVRNVGCELNTCGEVYWFRVAVTNYESIHNHNAFAMIERDKREVREEERL